MKITYKNKKYIKWPLAIPSFSILLTYSLVSLPLILIISFDASPLKTSLFFSPIIILKFLYEKNKILEVAMLLIAAVITLFNAVKPASYYETHLARANSFVKIQGTIINVHYPNKNLKWEQEKANPLIKLTKIYSNGQWFKCSGEVLIRNDENQLSYGEVIEAEGALFGFKDNSPNKIFSYRNYLKSNNLHHWLRIDKITERQEVSGSRTILKNLYNLRDGIIQRASAGLKTEENRRLLASMFFGYKGLLSPVEKETFQRSGTIHLFAVSGLHIGIAASLLFFLLKACRLEGFWLTVFLLAGLGIYVLMTGSPASAVRAYVMIAVWQVAKSYQLPSNGLNNICVAAIILLLFNPLNLISAGFLYSFTITAVLVSSYQKFLLLFQVLNEKQLWKRHNISNGGILMKIFLLFTCSCSASLAAFGLNLIINQRVIPFAFLTNVLISFLALCSFTLAVLCNTGLGFLYSLQDILLDVIRFAANKGEFSWTVFQPAAILILLYYLILFIFINTNQQKTSLISLCLLVASIVFLSLPSKNNYCLVTVPSSSNIPSIELQHEGQKYMINCSSALLAKMNYHQVIDCLILTDLKADHMRYLKDILENSIVRQLIIPKKETAYFKRLIKESHSSISSSQVSSANITFNLKEKKGEYLFSLQDNNAVSSLEFSLNRNTHNDTQLNLHYYQKNGPVTSHKLTLFYSNQNTLLEFPLNEPLKKTTSN